MTRPAPDWLVRLADQPQYCPDGHDGVVNSLLVGRGMQGIETVSIWHGTIEPEGHADPHVHPESDQIYIVVSGSIEVGVEDETIRMNVMDTACIPAGRQHWLVNREDVRAEVLVVSAPALR